MEKKTKYSCQFAFSALKWIHGLLPLNSNPLDSQLCVNLVEVERRAVQTPVKKKEPVDLELVQKNMFYFRKTK